MENQEIEKLINQINKKADKLAKTMDVYKFQEDYFFWNMNRKEGESSLDVKSRFFHSLKCEDPNLKILQDATEILLVEFGRICEENNIDYWLDFGTLLGAVRHGGFIPWDDDIDVGMMRNDIPRLKKAIEEADTCIEFSQYFCIGGDTCNIVRVIFKDVSIKVFVDIFIFDYCQTEDMYSTWRAYRKHRKVFSDDMLKYRPKVINDPEMNYWEKHRVYNEEHIAALEAEVAKYNSLLKIQNTPANYLIWGIDNFSFFSGRYGILETADIFPLGTMTFGERSYKVPHLWDKLLKARYGDYMALPKDILGHNHVNKTQKVLRKCEEMIAAYYPDQLQNEDSSSDLQLSFSARVKNKLHRMFR